MMVLSINTEIASTERPFSSINLIKILDFKPPFPLVLFWGILKVCQLLENRNREE